MLENKDQAIKLFGRTIQLGCSTSYGDPMIAERIQASAAADCTTSDGNLFCCKQAKTCQKEISARGEPASDDNNQDEESSSISILDESKTTTTTTQSTTSNHDNNPKTLEDDHKDPIEKEDESEEASTNQEAPKKPEEILACPRCNSMDTKFCYFNNYNVNQPRHFCKNCQRYWTAGGSMRTVPVGSGRRKTKTKSNPNSSSSSNGFVWPEMMTAGSTQGLMMPPQQMACFAWNPIPNWQSFYSAPPPPQWICTPPWNLHLLPHPSPPSPLLGKHCRDSHEEPTKEKRSTVAVPKTMRIADDPLEVARSSVCGGLAKNKDKPRCPNIGGGIFGGFHEYNKGVTVVGPERDHVCPRGSHVGINQANPAAFSRSLLFHEIGG